MRELAGLGYPVSGNKNKPGAHPINKSLSLSAALFTVLTQSGFSWGQTGFGPGQSMVPAEALREARAGGAPAVPNVAPAVPNVAPVEWISIEGGKFMMGTDDRNGWFKNAKPIHEVAIKNFEISKTLVTVEQYAQCVVKGGCTQPGTGGHCNWGRAGRQRHPINCVDWDQANQYARFKGARLPSESEWEYAAKSGGKNQKYPWGDEEPTCDKAVMYGCGSDGTMPVGSKPAGDTAQGLSDMAGNVWEWVQDKYQGSYAGVPADGGAFEGSGSGRVARGGSFYRSDVRDLRADRRVSFNPGHRFDSVGLRLVLYSKR